MNKGNNGYKGNKTYGEKVSSPNISGKNLLMSDEKRRFRRIISIVGQSLLALIASISLIALFFIFFFIFRDAIPFFRLEGFKEFFSSSSWYPSRDNPEFGALAIFVGSGLVTLGAIIVSVPLGILAALCLSDILPFTIRQYVKPVIEMLAAIPSVVYGFFSLVVFAPYLQQKGGAALSMGTWIILTPLALVLSVIVGDIISSKLGKGEKKLRRAVFAVTFASLSIWGIYSLSSFFAGIEVVSGTNAFNVSIILGIMALPVIVSVSEDALSAVGRDMREGSYALGATRAETLLKVIVPAARSGIFAAIILGIMRALGETMVVWMASGNAASIPDPWFNLMEPVRTLTATIAGDMGEADQVTGSARYHVLFAMAMCLLIFAFISNMVSEHFAKKARGMSR
ncbi:MAG: ABC transporter permease subunit [Candidatus Latescibacteria bacterium]|nr:ABC transporter permease subunit [bacterium]MBD3424616.1 ABC transporter permease subunit [Candidatus Latescibacterota bacterium]